MNNHRVIGIVSLVTDCSPKKELSTEKLKII